MLEVIKLFKQIQNTSSLNDKKAIITANKDNELFKKCLVFLLDGNITTGIAEKKYDSLEARCSDWKHNDISTEFCECLDYIKTHNTGRDEDVIQIQAWCYELDDEIKEFTRGMITKSIRLGADAKLVNKCIPNLIPTFDVQLGTSIEKVKLIGNEWIAISRKLNGTRCAFIGDKCMTRQGKEYKGLDHIIEDLQKLVGKDTFADGELTYKNKEGLSDSEAFQNIVTNSNRIFILRQFWRCDLIKDYIKYEEKEYQVSTVNIDGMLETMIFPVENGVVSGSEVYKFRTFDAGESRRKHGDIVTNVENYISKEAIKKYLEAKDRELGIYKIYDVEAEMYKANEHFPNTMVFRLNWYANLGFGELNFYYDTEKNKWECDSECMSGNGELKKYEMRTRYNSETNGKYVLYEYSKENIYNGDREVLNIFPTEEKEVKKYWGGTGIEKHMIPVTLEDIFNKLKPVYKQIYLANGREYVKEYRF